MTNEEYIKGALATEAPITDELLARVKASDTLIQLNLAFQDFCKQGERLDLFKKFMFYGKQHISIAKTEYVSIEPEIQERLNTQVVRLLHAALGMATESAERIKALMEHIYDGKELDLINLKEEDGDQFWYLALDANALGTTFEEIQELNNKKLLKYRYKSGKFSESEAINRDVVKERTALETK